MSDGRAILEVVPALAPFVAEADHVDVKVVEGAVDLRTFLAGMLSYDPAWMRVLYRVRWVFVRLLGMRQEGVPRFPPMRPSEVPFEPGARALFFTVEVAEEDRCWMAGITESHLTAHLGVVAEPVEGRTRFHVLTLVRYHRWTGPVYFNVIRPFHHVVVRRMARAGRRPRRA